MSLGASEKDGTTNSKKVKERSIASSWMGQQIKLDFRGRKDSQLSGKVDYSQSHAVGRTPLSHQQSAYVAR